MKNNIQTALKVMLIVLGTISHLGCSGGNTIPKVAFRHYEVVSAKAAKVVSENAPQNDGTVLVVVNESDSPHLKSQPDWFLDSAKTHELESVEILKIADEEWSAEEGWKPSLLSQVTTSYPNLRAVVSYVGPPTLEKTGNFSPWILVILPNPIPIEVAINQGAVDATISPSNIPADSPSLPKKASDDEFFDRYYQVIQH